MKLRATHETETYISQNGYFAIRQERHNEEQIVLLSPSQLAMLLEEIKLAVQEQEWWTDAITEEHKQD